MYSRFACLFAIMVFLLACSEDNTSKPVLDVPFSEAASSSSSFIETQSFSTDISSSSLEMVSSAECISSSSDTGLFTSSSSEMSSPTESSSSEWGPISYGELIDERDGQVYRTVKIGEQIWMAENLNYAYIQAYEHRDSTYKCENYDIMYCEWELYELDSLSFCYKNEPDSCAKYGRLYLWDAALNCGEEENKPVCKGTRDEGIASRGICPENWHIPSYNEWKKLANYVNYSADDLKSKSGWIDNGNGNDAFGFGGLPAGSYVEEKYSWIIGDPIDNTGLISCFWSASPFEEELSFSVSMNSSGQRDLMEAKMLCLESEYSFIWDNDADFKLYGFSVRCVMDSVASE